MNRNKTDIAHHRTPYKTVVRLVEVFLSDIDAEVGRPAIEQCALFVLRVHVVAQPILSLAVFLSLLYLNIAPLFLYGRPFTSLHLSARKKIVGRWDRSCVPVKRDIMVFLRSLTLLAYFDNSSDLDGKGQAGRNYQDILSFYNSGGPDA